jgi:transforming growth factor-beta-induced protein
MKNVRWHILSVALALTLLAAACAPVATPAPTAAPTEAPTTAPTAVPTEAPTAVPAAGQNIVEVAVADGRFTTLATALTEAGLVETLQGEGPFTVFAPTDEAFAKLPEGTLEALLADPEQLTAVLLYHVVAGEVPAADVVNLTEAETVQGELVDIRTDMGNVYLNDAQVILPDVAASNGLIHVIDTVLLPPSLQAQDIVDVAVADGRFTTLAAALTEADLVETLQGEGPFTVFAPTDDAFAKLPEGTLEALLADPEQLTAVLLYHVVAGDVPSTEVVNLTEAMTVQGESVQIRVEDGRVFVNDAEVIITDVEASNGVIHVIDTVIVPPSAG